ncbi:MAG: hypothetical protein RL095_1472 [Verrucomicrobiota bacterium]|jgi:hypothetical protein
MLKKVIITASALWALAARAEPGEAELLAGLPDYSQTGYGYGQEPPRVAPSARARDFGALPDDGKDDSAALQKALDEMKPGALLLETGSYQISAQLLIRRPGLVLRGAGRDKTTLRFAKSLEELKPAPTTNTGGTPTSAYSWSGGLIAIQSRGPGKALAQVKAGEGPRLTLARASELKPGQALYLSLKDDKSQSLSKALYAGDPGDIRKMTNQRLSLPVRVKSIAGLQVTLMQPLLFPVDPAWQPELCEDLSRSGCGVEELSLEFPATPYLGHFKERGWNGVELHGAHNWLRSLGIRNADSGVFVHGHHNSVLDLHITSKRPPAGKSRDVGHHAVMLSGSANLLSGYRSDCQFIHDLGLSSGSIANVFENCHGPALSFDHHKRGPCFNLFCDIDVGSGANIYRHGGGENLGRPCGRGTVFWNIRSRSALPAAPDDWAPADLLLVGVTLQAGSRYRVLPVPAAELKVPNPRLAQKTGRNSRPE